MPRNQKTPPKSKSLRAGLTLPVGRITTHFRKNRRTLKVGAETMVGFTAIIEHILYELIRGSLSPQCRKSIRTILKPDHIKKGINNDLEIAYWLGPFVIPKSSPSLNIPAALLKNKKLKKQPVVQEEQDQDKSIVLSS